MYTEVTNSLWAWQCLHSIAHAQLIPSKMAFVVRRFLSSSTRLYTAVANPAPCHRTAVLGTSELQSLSKKAQGHWKELSKEDHVSCMKPPF